MKTMILIVSLVLFGPALLPAAHAFGQSPTPTPLRRPMPTTVKPSLPATSAAGNNAIANLRPVFSVEDVQFQPPFAKVQVMNRGKIRNKPGETARLNFELMRGSKKELDATGSPMHFWVPGKPKPQVIGGWGYLTQEAIDKLPATTRIRQAFRRTISIPSISPGEAVWLVVDLTLPDPGTYSPTHKAVVVTSKPYHPPPYVDASDMNPCSNLTEFFASYIRINVRTEFFRSGEKGQSVPPSDPSVHATYGRQLPQAFFQFMDIPTGKYEGKCK